MSLQSGSKGTVRVFLTVYGRSFLAEAKYWLSIFVRRTFGSVAYELVVVDNAADRDSEGVYAGDNSSREFSGWDVAVLRSRPLQPSDWVVFVNDSFFRNYGRYHLYLFRPKMNRLDMNSILGWEEEAGFSLASGMYLQSYVRTNLFIMSGKLASLIGGFCSSVSLAVGPSLVEGELIARTNVLSSEYLERIEEWLISDKMDHYYDHKWYQATTLTDATRPSLFQKARCIINEHQLSFRAQCLGAKLERVNFPAKTLREKSLRAQFHCQLLVDELKLMLSRHFGSR